MSKIPVGLELYSVGASLAEDMRKTLEAVKEIGYETVEYAGWPADPAGFKAIIDELGLRCTSWHVGIECLEGEKLKETAEIARMWGCKRCLIPYAPSEFFNTLEKASAFIDRARNIQAGLKEYGLETGYHNHTHEFEKLEDGKSIWTHIAEGTDEDFTMQLDIGHATNAKGSPEEIYLKNRLKIVHVKPFRREEEGYNAFIGYDDVDYKRLFEFCSSEGATESYIVEFEGGSSNGMTDIEKARVNYNNLIEKFGDIL